MDLDSTTIGIVAWLAICAIVLGYIVSIVVRLAMRDQPPPRPVSPEEAAQVALAQAVRDARIKAQFGDIFKPGAVFDASALAPRLRRLRANFPGEVRTRRHPSQLRASLLAAARRTLHQRPYFRHHPPAVPLAPHGPDHSHTPA